MNNTYQNFWDNFQNLLDENGGEYSLEFINADEAQILYHNEETSLDIYIIKKSERVCLRKINKLNQVLIFSNNLNSVDFDSLISKIDEYGIKIATPKLKTQPTLIVNTTKTSAGQPGATLFQLGKTWQGRSKADLINKIFYTNHESFMPAAFFIDKYGADGVAWIVFINSKENSGWINTLTPSGDIIEEYVGVDKGKICERFIKKDRKTFCNKLVFQRDPDNNGNIYKAKCLGYYTLKSYDINTLTRIWKLESETLQLYLK